jgi:hypothetical protein
MRPDHAPNRLEEGFEDQLKKGLVECRGYFKDFLFTIAGCEDSPSSTLGCVY